MRKFWFLVFVAFSVLYVFSCSTAKVQNQEQWITTPSGLEYLDKEIGYGNFPKQGQRVTINFIMKTEDGTVIEDTYQSKIPMSFILGKKDAIQGLEEGVATMRVGGKRILKVPPELGFGASSVRGIPPNSKLIIEVELGKAE
jgi:peptidylprolyl isomerase